jgi:hypothetical protein
MSRDMTVSGPTIGEPLWCGDPLSVDRLYRGPNKLDAAAFSAPDAVVVTVGAAGALAAATSIPVDALSGAIPSGTILNFGTNKFARLTANAAAAATSLTVAAIPTALVDNDTATYAGATGRKFVPSGTVVTRNTTTAKWHPAVDADDYIAILAWDVHDLDDLDDCELVRSGQGTTVKANYLPVWTALSSAIKDRLILEYNITEGHE